MENIKKILKGGKEKPLKQYAVIQISTVKDKESGKVTATKHIFCDDKHIFIDKDLADKFCDHANKREFLNYQNRVIEYTLDS
jgi:hypothetical protein|tara:strand:- start:1586 stop:1831 length:246 start_codon:yes stop_codon:yes gene_type:complete